MRETPARRAARPGAAWAAQAGRRLAADPRVQRGVDPWQRSLARRRRCEPVGWTRSWCARALRPSAFPERLGRALVRRGVRPSGAVGCLRQRSAASGRLRRAERQRTRKLTSGSAVRQCPAGTHGQARPHAGADAVAGRRGHARGEAGTAAADALMLVRGRTDTPPPAAPTVRVHEVLAVAGTGRLPISRPAARPQSGC